MVVCRYLHSKTVKISKCQDTIVPTLDEKFTRKTSFNKSENAFLGLISLSLSLSLLLSSDCCQFSLKIVWIFPVPNKLWSLRESDMARGKFKLNFIRLFPLAYQRLAAPNRGELEDWYCSLIAFNKHFHSLPSCQTKLVKRASNCNKL